MPLFMDFHKIDADAFTEEDAYKGHLRDIAVQNKYGLVYKKYYLNLAQKTAFCLMEGPSKSACIESHQEAHGIGACNVIEVSKEHEFLPFMGEGSQNEQDLALTLSGEIDSGYRTLLLVRLVPFSTGKSTWKTKLEDVIKTNHGNLIKLPTGNFMASFIDASHAICAALKVFELLHSFKPQIDYNVSLYTGKPVDEHGKDIFEETKNTVNVFSSIGFKEKICMDRATKNSADVGNDISLSENDLIHIFNEGELKELIKLDRVLFSHFDNSSFKSQHFADELGLSRSQLYRKVNLLTGLSPNKLLTEFRLQRALDLLRIHQKTVSEIAYDCGFNSPTYFTRVFNKRFHTQPTSFGKPVQ